MKQLILLTCQHIQGPQLLMPTVQQYVDGIYFWLVWLTCQTPAVGGLIVCEWVSLCVRRHVAILLGAWWMADYETLHVCRVPYHDANNVSKFGGGPVTQLNLKKCFIILLTLSYGHGAPWPQRGHSFCGSCYAITRADYSSMEGHTSLSTALVFFQAFLKTCKQQ